MKKNTWDDSLSHPISEIHRKSVLAAAEVELDKLHPRGLRLWHWLSAGTVAAGLAALLVFTQFFTNPEPFEINDQMALLPTEEHALLSELEILEDLELLEELDELDEGANI